MSSDTTVYTDSYGEVSEAQWRLYRECNVSPSDHDMLVEVYGGGPIGRDQIMAAVREFTRDGMYREFDMVRDARRKGRI
ncbi:hypothetical protein H7J07_05835 [Mycobacterium koreense]|uniref:Uncharacterized protein n=1 Tax=Mycolicibacillus koreensis TaxID=1069220 RepID=A0A7I7SCB3_9MYCO|nr:hypothetical protein [Mycolicibacillus koreensis]MCV7247746.1 hypothetical protein [Mycolicibacillus koreensis]OSC34729.1 hypothetical protein B8W67_05630 [Mycolicibacillus koreensis]BBY54130.1 hypothetical protein MKOR_13810 [Mycolicibacillus koreensis]